MEPRPFAFHKMEALLKQMQDPESGVPVRSQKIFLTSIPSAFTGYDLIEWLMEHLNIEESGEAVHLANQLCQYGYLFPVTDCKNLTVKDDNSLYRFQAAYYWPWHHRNPDNVEYAIYLVKRTLRNKQRHALEDYEVDALTSLKKNLQNKWELITMQAEEQAEDGNIIHKQSGILVKVGKERKKMEKLVADSQERAYWRVHRPPPGCQPPLEPAPISSLRKNTNPPQHNTQVEILRRQVSRSRIKVSQAVESLVTYSNTYSEYDPLLCQPQPSNPWLSDDSAFWQFNLPIVEIPTEKRVKRWALSFEDLLADPSGVEEFTNYLRKEYSHENIRFWLAVKELRHCAQSQVPIKVNNIYQEFLTKGAPCEINIDSKTLETTLNELKTPSRFTFDVAAHHVYAVLLKKDCYPRFIRSEQYKNLLANAVHPPTKKKFFVFGGGGKKKSCPGPVATMAMSKRRGSDRSLTGIVHEAPAFSTQQSHVPLSSSQANLHDVTVCRDSGVSPERIKVPYSNTKQKSIERKTSEDDKLVYEGVSQLVPGTSSAGSTLMRSTSQENRDEGNNIPVKSEKVTEYDRDKDVVAELVVAKFNDASLGADVHNSRENLGSKKKLVHAIEKNVPVLEVTSNNEDDLHGEAVTSVRRKDTQEPESESPYGNTVIADRTVITDKTVISDKTVIADRTVATDKTVTTEKSEPVQNTDTPIKSVEVTEMIEEVVDESKKLPKEGGTRRTRKEGARKARLLSEEMRQSSTEERKSARKPSLVALEKARLSVEDVEGGTSGQHFAQESASSDQTLLTGKVHPGAQNPADICPWEDEESCKTEETFVKKYATLGYL